MLFTEADYKGCEKGSITICAATTAVYNTQALKCEASLFFKSEGANRLCRRKLIFHHLTPFLQRHGELWIYHFPREQQVTLRCMESHNQVLRTLSVTAAGLLLNATRCYVTSDEFQTFPELHGTTHTKLSVPTLHLPDITVVTDFELKLLKDILPLETRQLNDVHDRVIASLQTYDVESLLHSHQTSLFHERRTNNLIIVTTSLCAIPIISILCFILYSHT